MSQHRDKPGEYDDYLNFLRSKLSFYEQASKQYVENQFIEYQKAR